MSDKKRYPLATARQRAECLLKMLAPVCERIEIVGSIRRQRPDVGDVELLLVPREEMIRDGLFDQKRIDLADIRVEQLLKRGVLEKRLNTAGFPTWGKQNKLAVHVWSGIPVDIFATTAAGWFRSLVIRTGPKELNITLIKSAAKSGVRIHAYGDCGCEDMRTGKPIPVNSEREFFEICGVPYLEPHERQ
jgi:DNA polymerase/3'-5' exonuclease PolX